MSSSRGNLTNCNDLANFKMTNSVISRPSDPLQTEEVAHSSASSLTVDEHQLSRILKSYQAVQQVKYLHLQAEIDVLWQHLQTLKQQKQDK